MPNSYLHDVIFNLHLPTIKDSYNPERMKIADNFVGYARILGRVQLDLEERECLRNCS